MYKWIIGLGNYPSHNINAYQFTRHNTGGDLIIFLMNKLRLKVFSYDDYCTGSYQGVNFAILIGFINSSGSSLKKLISHEELDEVLILHDDVELPYGCLQYKQGGSSKGHNGLRNIQETFQTNQYDRIRIGISKSSPLFHYVLDTHSKEEMDILLSHVDYCYNHLEDLMNSNFKGIKC